MKLGLWLVIIEGWTSVENAVARFGSDAPQVIRWLGANGYAEVSRDQVRWVPTLGFEALWGELFPERLCPIQISPSVIPLAELT